MIFRRNMYPFQSSFPYSYPMRQTFNWGNFLSNAQKTVAIINQAIPIAYLIGPMYRNARTMFRVFNEFNKIDTSSGESTPVSNSNNSNTYNTTESYNNTQSNSDNNPNFFI